MKSIKEIKEDIKNCKDCKKLFPYCCLYHEIYLKILRDILQIIIKHKDLDEIKKEIIG